MSKSSGNREIGFLRRVVCGRESFCSHPQRRTRNVALTRATAFGRAADPRKADFSSCGLQALPRVVCAGICGSDWNPRTVRSDRKSLPHFSACRSPTGRSATRSVMPTIGCTTCGTTVRDRCWMISVWNKAPTEVPADAAIWTRRKLTCADRQKIVEAAR